MTRTRPLALVALVLAAVVALAVVLWPQFPGPVPDGYATFRDDVVELRHPPGWEVRREGDRRITFRPPGAAGDERVMVLERELASDAAFERARRLRERLARGTRVGQEDYDTAVPGSEVDLGTTLSGVVTRRGDGTRTRVTTAVGVRNGTLVALHVRGPATDGGSDPRRAAATLRLDR